MGSWSTFVFLAMLGLSCSALIIEREPRTSAEVTANEEEEDQMVINSTVVLDGNRTLPSTTEIPDCPSYVSCPWVYPQPITSEATPEENNPDSENSSSPVTSEAQETDAMPEVETTVQEFTTTSTEIPDCPSYVSCPWVYPQPITDRNDDPDKNPETSQTQVTEDTDSSGNGPSIPATPKPGYPSVIPGPWIYPMPVEPEVTAENSTTETYPESTTENVEETTTDHVEYIENITQKPSISATQKPGVPSVVGGPWIYPKPIEPEVPSRPSIPATPKPLCPSYVSCPWIYPQPTTEQPPVTSEKVPLVEYFGSNHQGSQSTEKPASSTQRPAISATQKPGFPSVVGGPWIYPKPIEPEVPVENSTSVSTTTEKSVPTQEPLVEYFGSNQQGTQSTEKPASSTQRPAISATQKPGFPSVVGGPWIYPKPIEPEVSSENSSAVSTTTEQSITTKKPIVEYFGSSNSQRPAISATQKPGYPSYVPGPWIYPKPVGEGSSGSLPPQKPGSTGTKPETGDRIDNNPTKKPGNYPVKKPYPGEPTSTTQIPDCPSYVSCPWIYPQPITDPPVTEYFGSDADKKPTMDPDRLEFPGPTTRHPSKKPSLLFNSLWNPINPAERFPSAIDYDDDLTDIIETYAANFFLYSPKIKQPPTGFVHKHERPFVIHPSLYLLSVPLGPSDKE